MSPWQGQVGGLNQVGPISFRLVEGVVTHPLHLTPLQCVYVYCVLLEGKAKFLILHITPLSHIAHFNDEYIILKAVLEDTKKTQNEKTGIVGCFVAPFPSKHIVLTLWGK